jgi:hypothetical protein
VNSHPYGISKLTTAHSEELLTEGRRRQLARTTPPRLRSHRRRLLGAWTSWILDHAASLVTSAVYVRRGGVAKTK